MRQRRCELLTPSFSKRDLLIGCTSAITATFTASAGVARSAQATAVMKHAVELGSGVGKRAGWQDPVP